MPLTGNYEPSPAQWVSDQVELYESSGGTEGTTLRGMPVVVITSRGAKSGTLRKNPVMRVEHDGQHQDVGRGAFAVAGVAAAVVVGAGAGAGGEAAERPGPAGSNEAAVPTPPQHHPPFARGPGDWGGAGVGAPTGGVREACRVIAELGDQPGGHLVELIKNNPTGISGSLGRR